MIVKKINNQNLIKQINFLLYLLLSFSTKSFAQIPEAKILNDVRTFEVSACKPSTNEIIAVWMEKRPERKDNSADAADMRVAYKYSADNGKTWSKKDIIDAPNTFGIGNPYVYSNDKKEVFLVCMHIGKEFWEGNISFYEFDFKKKLFRTKSIPVESPDSLLDKPAIVSSGNNVHLVYVAYPKGKKNAVRYQMSTDKGKSWSKAIDVFDNSGSGFLGSSITLSKNNQPIISCGAYGTKNIQIVKKSAVDSNAFDKPITVDKINPELAAALTEINRFDNKYILTWQNPHQRNQCWLSTSGDDANNWSKPQLITQYGNLLSASFDKKGLLHCIYSNFINDNFYVGYKNYDANFNLIQEKKLKNNTPYNTFQEYLGAFQKLLIQDNQCFAFWIDYTNESTLMFSNWKFSQ